MANKIDARIRHKHDTEENWLKATNFIPLLGEMIVYDPDASYSYARIKIGDGVNVVSALPFLVDDAPFKPTEKFYLTFSSPNSFTLAVGDTTKHWDGTLEYSTDSFTWSTWNGTTTLSAVDNNSEYVLYLRGTGNTKICYYDRSMEEPAPWVINGANVRCDGNIENLLDYATVKAGQHPTMAEGCFFGLFMGCVALITPPELPATTLVSHCYNSMFYGCADLTKAPALPATTLAVECYSNMFNGCTGLIQAPALPATTLAYSCYSNMFNGCTGLIQAPALPATTLAESCYVHMFRSCTALIQAPALPATTLADSCYSNMFNGCTGLIQAPALPATTLADSCYKSMFRGCTALIQAPALPATTLEYYCYSNMFSGCTALTQAPPLPATTLSSFCYHYMFLDCISLTQAPALPATTLADSCYRYMFYNCTALTQAPILHATTLANNCYAHMFNGCTSIKLSSSKTDEYTQEYRIPSSGTGTTATNALTDMFKSTGGTFTGTPEINTIYYLSTDNMVVHDTEIATMNGYVGSMIDAVTPESIGAAASIHASQHSSGGSDPITPASIGAAASGHNHNDKYYTEAEINNFLQNYLPLSGGTLIGNLTGKYITGTWLQATANNHQSTAAAKVAVFDSSGWVYYRTIAELLADLGIPDAMSIRATESAYGTTKLSTSVTSTSKSLAATPYAVKTALDNAKAYTDSAIGSAIAASY